MNKPQYKQVTQMETERQRKVRRAKWLVTKEGYTPQRAAQVMGVTIREIKA